MCSEWDALKACVYDEIWALSRRLSQFGGVAFRPTSVYQATHNTVACPRQLLPALLPNPISYNTVGACCMEAVCTEAVCCSRRIVSGC